MRCRRHSPEEIKALKKRTDCDAYADRLRRKAIQDIAAIDPDAPVLRRLMRTDGEATAIRSVSDGKLMGCPFCGAKIKRNDVDGWCQPCWSIVHKDDCFFVGGRYRDGLNMHLDQESVKRWNRRSVASQSSDKK